MQIWLFDNVEQRLEGKILVSLLCISPPPPPLLVFPSAKKQRLCGTVVLRISPLPRGPAHPVREPRGEVARADLLSIRDRVGSRALTSS